MSYLPPPPLFLLQWRILDSHPWSCLIDAQSLPWYDRRTHFGARTAKGFSNWNRVGSCSRQSYLVISQKTWSLLYRDWNWFSAIFQSNASNSLPAQCAPTWNRARSWLRRAVVSADLKDFLHSETRIVWARLPPFAPLSYPNRTLFRTLSWWCIRYKNEYKDPQPLICIADRWRWHGRWLSAAFDRRIERRPMSQRRCRSPSIHLLFVPCALRELRVSFWEF